MDPATIGLILGGLGTLGGLIGTPGTQIGDASDVQLLNAEQLEALTALLSQQQLTSQGLTNQFADLASQQYGNLADQASQLGGIGLQQIGQGAAPITQGLGALSNAGNLLTSLQGQLANVGAYDPTRSTELLEQTAPIYQDLATQARDQALSQFETPAAVQAQMTADRNLSSVANQFAGLGASTSGAAAAAAAQGAQAPLAQMAVDRANLANQAFSGVYNPLIQQGQMLASQENQMAYNAGVQNILNQINAAVQQGQFGATQAGVGAQQQGIGADILGTGAALAGQSAGGQAGLSSLYAGLQGQALSGLTSLGQPQYWQPTYQQGSGLLGLLDNFGIF